MLETQKLHDWLGKASQHDGTDEGPWDGAWEGEVVIAACELPIYIGGRRSIDKYIMCCLDIERFLHFGIWSYKEMDENQSGDEKR